VIVQDWVGEGSVLRYGIEDSEDSRTGGAGPPAACCDGRPLLAIPFSLEGIVSDTGRVELDGRE
jgi:hypothetical protein